MQKLKSNSTRHEVLAASQMGIEFEFYSNLELKKTQKSLSELLDRKIQLEEKAHSDFVPSADVFKMEPDMSGGAGLIELVTGPMPYRNARLVIVKMLGWIRENGYTSDRASIHLNMSFNPDYLEEPNMIQHMDVLKFILEFDEDRVYKYFPNREDSTYAKSIKWIMPKHEAFYYNADLINKDNFTFANTKYYGINFEKAQSNYLEFRYIGGKDYEKRQEDILTLADRFKHKVLDLLSNGTMEEGIINYDSDYSTVQVKDGKFKVAYLLDGFEFIDCELSGNIENSEIYGGQVNGAQILRSQIYKGCEIMDSKVESCFVHGSVTVKNCFVFGRDGIFKGRMEGGIFREGGVGPNARFSDETEVVVSKKIKS